MQSLFNKRHGKKSEINQIFTLPPTNIVHTEPEPVPLIIKESQAIDQQDDNPRQTEAQKQEKLSRTIFIGNVKIDTNKKDLKKLLLPFGKVQKVWYRSVPVEHSKMGPKASYILRKFQQNAESMNAYARFEDVQQAESALQLNGRIFNQLTLRVSSANHKEENFDKTIFIGNLPFDVKEQELRKFFSKVGKIQNVRVIRNKFSHEGIGIGYIMFNKEQQMKKAIADLNGSEFRGRNLRIKKAVQKKRLDKKKRKFTDPKQVNRNAAMKRIQQKNNQTETNYIEQQKPQQSKPNQKSNSNKKFQTTIPKTKRISKPQQTNPKKKDKSQNIDKKKPHVIKQDTEEDKQLRNEVTEQLKLLKRSMN